MKYFFTKVIKNLAGMLITKKFIIWALKLAAKNTKTKIDDSVILLVEAAYDNKPDEMQKQIETLSEIYFDRKQAG